MAADALPTSLQESVLTTLVFDVKHGSIVAAQIEPEVFDDPYREIARRVLDYRTRFGKPPGQAHLDDLFGEALGDPTNRRSGQMRRVLLGLAAQAEGLNAEYVAGRVGEFAREQRIKQAILRAGERYQQGGEGKIEEITDILRRALDGSLEQGFDPGYFLNDVKRTLAFLDIPNDSIPLGIAELDKQRIGPTAKEMLLYIAPKGTGKTMFAVHCGTQGLLHRQRVVHITNETSAERVVGRYYQRFFGLSRRQLSVPQMRIKLDALGRYESLEGEKVKLPWALSDPKAKGKLRAKIKEWGARLGNLVVRDFPTGGLNVNGLNRYLDYLEKVQRFIPTMLIIDSPDLMEIKGSDFRIGTRRTFEQVRGIFVERCVAGICTTQGNRDSIGAKRVRSTDVAEDISKVQTADNVFTFSRTDAEKVRGLGRLTVEHARNEEGGLTVLLTQNYALGQYVVDSVYMDNRYWAELKKMNGEDEE